MPPQLRDRADIELILEMIRVAEWRRLGVSRASTQSRIGMPKNVEPFGIGRHQSVLDTVVNHLHEMTGTMIAAVKIAARGGARPVTTRREGGEHRFNAREVRTLSAHHEAVTAFEAQHAATSTDIHVMNAGSL